MSPEFRKLLSQHVGSAFAKQLAFAELLGERGWGVDLGAGQATFGDDLCFPIQLLGTESDGDNSWLWGWANQASNLPAALLKSGEDLKALGEELNIAELKERSYSTNVADGHAIAMVASVLNPLSCYYRGPYDGGALYFLLNDLPPQITAPVSPQQAVSVISQVISVFDVDHRLMITAFLTAQGYAVSETEALISAVTEAGDLTFAFDAEGRLADINGNLQPA